MNDVPVSNYLVDDAEQEYEAALNEFAEPLRRHSLDDMEITDLMDVDFDTELPSEVINLDMDLPSMPRLENIPMDMDEDNEFMTEHLFEKLASLV